MQPELQQELFRASAALSAGDWGWALDETSRRDGGDQLLKYLQSSAGHVEPNTSATMFRDQLRLTSIY
ncbi:MAG: hypothetical protein R3C10_17335 [Pirellulales bacterium]